MLRTFLTLALIGSALADFPVIPNSDNCIAGQKFLMAAGSPWIMLCKEQNFNGHIIKQSQVVGCVAYDKLTEVPIGGSFINYSNSAKTMGFRIACKKTATGQMRRETDACVINNKVVEFGEKGVLGHSLCSCERNFNIKCEKINVFEN